MNRLAGAFDRLQKSKSRAVGKEEFVLLNGRKKSALVSEITSDEAFIMGGTATAGGFSVSMAQSIQPNAPEKFTPIEVRGNKLQVLSVNDRNGVTWEIQAGDPSSESQ